VNAVIASFVFANLKRDDRD